MASVTAGGVTLRRPIPLGPFGGVARAVYRVLTSVRFAVLQIVLLALAGVIGMTLQQLPGFAFRSQADYAAQMALIHARYDAVLGAPAVGVMERLGLFGVFTAPWFGALLVLLVASIVVCTLNRVPRLWRGVRDVRVVQPDGYFDPSLPDRAALDSVDPAALRAVLRRHRFRVREAEVGGTRYQYGDRNQYAKLATLLTHLGLVLFLVAAAVTSRFGFEAGILIPAGEAVPVQRLGTPGNLVVKNLGFEAPQTADGRFADFRTDLAVYRDGALLARKTIRVNDPLTVAGFSFHQNFFGPAVDLEIRDAAGGLLWQGPVPLDGQSAGRPYGRLAVPGRAIGLELLLDRAADGAPLLAVIGSRANGTQADGTPFYEAVFVGGLTEGRTLATPAADFSIRLIGVGAYTGIVAKQDPGQGIVWLAFLCLIAGLTLTFYLPRRRIWTRLGPDGSLAIVARADRYVNLEREFGSLLADLVAVRQPAGGGGSPLGAGATPIASGRPG